MLEISERIRQYEPFFGVWRLDNPPVVLGEGNSGVVFLIHDGDIEAALKVIAIPRDQVALDEMYHRYGSEANVNAVIDHEHQYAAEEIRIMRKLKGLSNIVCFEDSKIYPRSDTYGWDVIIRMERLVRLDEFLEKPSRYGYRWNLNMVLKIWTDLVNGLYYCERNGIVHMDIKPDNIFYTGENMNLFKLGDFGVSIRSENGKVSAGIEAGTRAYMSPEIHSAQGGDVRSDIYSLAMVIYELLNDECLPFMSRHPTDVELDRAVEKRCMEGTELPPIKDLDPAFSRILMRCLRYKPEERYQTMRELNEDLQKYVMRGGKPEPPPLPKWLLPVIGIGTVGALAFVGFLIFRPQQIAPLSPVESALIDHATGNIVVRASTEMYAQLLVKGQKGEKVRLDITREGTTSRVSGNEIILNSNGSQSIWSYSDHALEDGIYQFLAYYPDQPDSQPLLLEATIDRNAPDVPSLEGDLPVASVDWELRVFAEAGATVKLYAGDEVIATQIADPQGLASFSRVFEANVNYGLTATDAVGNESARYSFNAIVREIVAQLSEVDEDSEALIITADAEGVPNLAENGHEVPLEKTDAAHYRYVPPEGFAVGAVYTLTVTDQYGITASDEKTVAASPWRKIELSTEKVDNEVFLISGMAEDGTQVQLMWNGEPFGDPMTVVDGGFSVELNMADVGIDENGGSGTLSAQYAQGAASRASDAVQVRWASTVEPVYYAQIHLMTIPELGRQGEARVVSGATSASLQLFLTDGSGELPVEVTLTDEQGNETIYSEALTLSANGTVQLDAGLDGLDDGQYTLSAAYQEQPEARYAWGIIVDRTPPDLELDAPSPYVGVEWTLDVSTEPGARVALFADDAQIDAATALDDGRATFVHTFEAGTAYHIEAEDACGNRGSLTVAPVVRRVIASFDGANEDDERLLFNVDTHAVEFELARNGERQPDSAVTLLSEDDDGSVYAWQPPEGHLTSEDVFTLTVRDEYGLTGTDEVTVGSSAWRTIELEIHGANETDVINSRFIGDSVIELRDGTPGEMVDWRIYREGETEPILSGAEQLSDDGGMAITGAFIELEDGDYTFIAAYGEQPGKRYTLDFAVDVTPPTLAIDEPSPYIGAEWTLNIRTEAGARVALLANGAELDSAIVPDDGQVAFTYTFEANVEYQIAAEDAFGNRGVTPVVPVVRRVVAAIEKANEDDSRLLFRIDAEAADFELTRNGDVLDKAELIEEPDGVNGTAYAWQPPEGHLTMDDVFTLTVWDIYGLTGSDERSVSASAWPEIGIAISAETLNSQSVNSAVVALSDGAPGEPVDWFIVGTSATQPVKSGTARLSAEDGACEIEDAFTGIEDGEYRFVVRYSAQPDKQNEASFALDTTPPTLSVDDSSPYAEVDWVTRVDTEPGARVSLLVNGAAAQSKLADNTRTVEFNYVYNVGADCVVQATDAAGNVSRVSIKPQVKSVMARVLPLNETDDTVLFTVDADTDSFELLHNGVRVPESEIESLGGEEYGWYLSEGHFAVGDNIRLTVWDVYGLEATDAQIVEQVDWAQIELKVNNGYQGGNTVYRSTLEVIGSAQANETVQLLWNGKPVGGEIRTGSDGAFSAALPIADTALPETGGTGMLSARYASGFAADRAAESQQVTWTPKETVRLDVQSLSEDSEVLVIETDPGATLTITQRRNGNELFTDEWVSASGREAWTLPDGGIFTEGDEFTIHARDMIGNENDATRRVAASSRRKITFEMANRFDWAAHNVPVGYPLDTVIERQARLSIDAEPGQALEVLVNGVSLGRAVADADTGAAQVPLDWNAVSGRLGAASGSALTLNVRYADGRAPKLAASRKLMWTPDDDVALDETNGALRLYKNDALTIHTDPYARITISFQDASYSVLADGNGLAKWTPDSSVEIGAAYVVTVTDMFGHQRTSAKMYVEEVRREKIEVEAPEIIGSRLTLNGFAEGGTTIAYDVNGKSGTVELGGQPGTREAFEIPILDADVLGISSGDEVRIQLFYADGASPSQTIELKPFIWDWKVDLNIETVSEDSDAIVAHCGEAVTASLYLAADGGSEEEKIATVQSPDGELRWPVDELPVWLDRYARGRIEVKDLYGNTAEERFNVERTAYRDIDLSIASDVSYNGMAAVTADRVTISGYAEPNHEVALAFLALDAGGDDAVFTHIETVTASGNGAYAHEFRLDALEAAEGGAWTLASEGDRFQIRAYYQDARHAMWSETMFWDCKGPALTMDGGDTLDRNWRAISGSTEAGATVEMLVNSASAAKKTAENGKFVFKPSDLSSQMRDLTGKTVRIVAHDALGNESEPWERTVETVAYPGRVAIVNQLEDGSVSGALEIVGWFAGFDPRDALLTIDGAAKGKVSSAWDVHTMTADERAAYLGGSADSYRESECCVFTARYELTNAAAGECRLILSQDSYMGVQEIMSVDFTIVKSAAESRSLYINAEAGVAMDVDPIESSFRSGDILLTGWCYVDGRYDSNTMLREVRISSVTQAVPEIRRTLSEAVVSEVIASGKNQCAQVDRDIMRATDAAIRRQLPGVTPSNNNAGFIIYLGDLGTTLPDGEYNVTILAAAGADMTPVEIKNVSLRIEAGASAVSTGRAMALASAWAPVIVVPTATPAP